MTTWTCEMKDMTGATVVSDVFAYAPEATFGQALNGPGAMTFRMPVGYADTADYVPGHRTLHIKKDGTVVWGGFLLAGESDRDYVSFSGKSWEFGLTQNIISGNERYKDTEQLDIAWDLVNTYVTKPAMTRNSATPSGKTRQITYCCDDMTNVYDAVNDLAGMLYGFDFWIGPADLKWYTGYPHRGTDLSGSIVFDDTTNFTVTKKTDDAENSAGRIWFTIPGIGTCSDLQYRDYGGSPATWIREDGLNLDDVRLAADRQERVDEALRAATPRRQFTGTVYAESGIDHGDFDLGDLVWVSLSRGWHYWDNKVMVLDWKVTLKEACVESIDVTLDNMVWT